MEDFIIAVSFLLGFVILCFLCFSLLFFLFEDPRPFNTIKKQCQTNGFIQNETVRINCSLEKPQ